MRERVKLGSFGGQARRPGGDKHVNIIYSSVPELFRSGRGFGQDSHIATKPLDHVTIQKRLAACGLDVGQRAADEKKVCLLTGRAQQAPSGTWGLQACIQGLASWAAICSL